MKQCYLASYECDLRSSWRASVTAISLGSLSHAQ